MSLDTFWICIFGNFLLTTIPILETNLHCENVEHFLESCYYKIYIFYLYIFIFFFSKNNFLSYDDF